MAVSDKQKLEIKRLWSGGMFPTAIGRRLGLSRMTVRRALGYRDKPRGASTCRPADDRGAYLPTPEEIETLCATFRQRRRPENETPEWSPPVMGVCFARGRGARLLAWKRDDDAVPAA